MLQLLPLRALSTGALDCLACDRLRYVHKVDVTKYHSLDEYVSVNLFLRTYALYGRSRRILVLMLTVTIAVFAVASVSARHLRVYMPQS